MFSVVIGRLVRSTMAAAAEVAAQPPVTAQVVSFFLGFSFIIFLVLLT